MQRFCIENLTFSDEIEITSKEHINQICKVLRARVWDEFLFFNGTNFIDYKYSLTQISKKSLKFSKLEEIKKEEDKSFVNLFVWMPNKLEKLEFIIQKGVEVWVSEFTFFRSERSQKLPLSDNKIVRLERILEEALEQSYRNFKPKLNFADALEFPKDAYFFHTRSGNSKWIFDYDFKEDKTNIFVGPEGWFSESEISNFENLGYKKIHLWNWILRCETCSISASFFIKQAKNKDH